MSVCDLCGRPLDNPDDRWSPDCGGDCWGCMWWAEEDWPDPEDRASTDTLKLFAEEDWWRGWSRLARAVYADRKAAEREHPHAERRWQIEREHSHR